MHLRDEQRAEADQQQPEHGGTIPPGRWAAINELGMPRLPLIHAAPIKLVSGVDHRKP